jgi:hypothetical protein
VGNAFVGYVDTFCVDPSYAPKTVVATTTENSSLVCSFHLLSRSE